jgi:hypothetical protein
MRVMQALTWIGTVGTWSRSDRRFWLSRVSPVTRSPGIEAAAKSCARAGRASWPNWSAVTQMVVCSRCRVTCREVRPRW